MEQKLHIIIFWALLYLDIVFCANILMIHPASCISHSQFITPFAEEIIKRGHNLTLISKFHLSDQFHGNYSFISLEKIYQNLSIPFEHLVTKSEFKCLSTLFTYRPDNLHAGVRSQEIQHILLSENHYDLIIAEFVFSDAYFAFASKFNAPVIGYYSSSLLSFQNWVIGQEFPASYVPNTFSSLSHHMSLFSRIHNALVNVYSILGYELFNLPDSQAVVQKYFHFGKGKIPRIKDVLKNVSVFLVNAHHSFGYAKPELPNVVHVAGLHLIPPKPLANDIRIFMEEAEHGVIYISLGSVLPPNLYQPLGEIFIRVLGNVPQRIIMKWDRELLPFIPNNTLIREWLPQSDILNHPNCRLFISHGGLLGMLESLNASVPVVGIPFFADQHHNVAILEYYKIGIALQYEDVSSQLLEKVGEVLNNQIYKENIERRSRLFRDRPVSPMDEAMYWVDYVIKHKDTSHMRPASTEMTWYQFYSLDLVLVFLISVLSILYLIIKSFVLFLRFFTYVNTKFFSTLG